MNVCVVVGKLTIYIKNASKILGEQKYSVYARISLRVVSSSHTLLILIDGLSGVYNSSNQTFGFSGESIKAISKKIVTVGINQKLGDQIITACTQSMATYLKNAQPLRAFLFERNILTTI